MNYKPTNSEKHKPELTKIIMIGLGRQQASTNLLGRKNGYHIWKDIMVFLKIVIPQER